MRVLSKKTEAERVLREYLRASGLRPGDRIPGERELAAALGLGRTALRPLLASFEGWGVLERRPQSGTFLRALPAPDSDGVSVTLIAPFQGTGEPGRETDPLWLYRVASAFERVAIAAGASLTLSDQSTLANDPCSVKDLIRNAVAKEAQAVVLLHPLGSREKIAHALAVAHDAGIHPVIVSSRTYPGLASQIYFDSQWGAYTATRYLLNQGHVQIGFAGAPDGHEWVQDRLRGFRSALEAADHTPDPAWTWLPTEAGSERLTALEDGVNALDYFLTLPEQIRPTALVAANDLVARGILQRAAEVGVSVPRQLSVVGFDNDPGALLAGLTTIERPTEALGEVAARATLERVAAGEDADTVTHRLRPKIIERNTVGPPGIKAGNHPG